MARTAAGVGCKQRVSLRLIASVQVTTVGMARFTHRSLSASRHTPWQLSEMRIKAGMIPDMLAAMLGPTTDNRRE